MDWGTQKADKMKLEAYIDATEQGKFLYEKCGFVAAERIDFVYLSLSRVVDRRRWREFLRRLVFGRCGDLKGGNGEKIQNVLWIEKSG